jgi:hypothetical protein
MTHRFRSFVVAAAVAMLPCASAAAQGTQIVKKGYTDIGATVGLGGLGEAGLSVGGRFEKAFKDLPDYGNGTLGIGLSAEVYSYDFGSNYTYRYIPLGATVNYHFNLSNKKLVPFLGLGLGYSILNCSYDGPTGGIDLCPNSDIYFIGRAGARYFMSEKLALYGDVGAGAATLNLGVMFRLR